MTSLPADPPGVGAILRRLAGGDSIEPVWRNELGGVTFRLGGTRFAEIGPRQLETTRAGEAERMSWARPFTPVPRMVEVGGDADLAGMVSDTLPAGRQST